MEALSRPQQDPFVPVDIFLAAAHLLWVCGLVSGWPAGMQS